MKKLTVAVIFGGTNTEHEVAIITALQVMHALKDAGHRVLPVYISKDNRWLLGDRQFLKPTFYKNLNQVIGLGKKCLITNPGLPTINLYQSFGRLVPEHPFDIAFPVFHGRYGEDGTIQGLLTLQNIPIAGPSLSVSGIGVDKYLSKRLAESVKIPVLADLIINYHQWQSAKKLVIDQAFKLSKQLIIKPNTLGSSIGIAVTNNPKELENALDVAFSYDSRVLVEPALMDFSEVNISIMGNNPYTLSTTEAPLRSTQLLSFEDKYTGNKSRSNQGAKGMASAKRHIPAPLNQTSLNLVKDYATRFFESINGQGLSRIDFMVFKDKLYFNEINPIPGSLAFYLWEKTGYPFPKLVNRLLELGMAAHRQNNRLIKTFESNILQNMPLTGKKT